LRFFCREENEEKFSSDNEFIRMSRKKEEKNKIKKKKMSISFCLQRGKLSESHLVCEHVDCAKVIIWRIAHSANMLSYKSMEDICCAAASQGYIKVLKFLHGNGFPLTTEVCVKAVAYLDCIKYLHENNCKWDEKVFAAAAEFAPMNVMVYLHHNKCPWDNSACTAAAKRRDSRTLEFLRENSYSWDKNTCVYAAKYGRYNCLKYVHQNGCPMDINQTIEACFNGYVKERKNDFNDCLYYISSTGLKGSRACDIAARYSSILLLKPAQELGAHMDKCTFMNAAIGGSLECVKYLHTSGCEWDESACSMAAKYGHLECLSYLHAHGCPWDKEVCKSAILGNHFDCLVFFCEKSKHFVTEDIIRFAVKYGSTECIIYLYAINTGQVSYSDLKRLFHADLKDLSMDPRN
jgi:hypothetical protein